MRSLSDTDVRNIIALIQATRENLDRIEAKLTPQVKLGDELDTRNPLNKDGVVLTPRGVETCYRLFDQNKTRYAVAQAMEISYGAATHRFHAWEKIGGKNRVRRPLD